MVIASRTLGHCRCSSLRFLECDDGPQHWSLHRASQPGLFTPTSIPRPCLRGAITAPLRTLVISPLVSFPGDLVHLLRICTEIAFEYQTVENRFLALRCVGPFYLLVGSYGGKGNEGLGIFGRCPDSDCGLRLRGACRPGGASGGAGTSRSPRATRGTRRAGHFSHQSRKRCLPATLHTDL